MTAPAASEGLDLDRRVHVLTPESVVFTYREAGAYSRLLAWTIDGLLLAAILLAGLSLLSSLATISLGLAEPLLYIYAFLVTSGYFVFWESRPGASSPGKRALGLRVIRDDGLKPTLAQIVARNVLRPVDGAPLLYAAALVVTALSRRTKRLGDHVAATLVVAEDRAAVPRALDTGRESLRRADPAARERVRRRATVEERDLFLAAALRRDELRLPARIAVFRDLARHAARRFDLETPEHLSDENLVCEVAAMLAS